MVNESAKFKGVTSHIFNYNMATTESVPIVDPAKTRRDKALEDYRKRLIDHKELEDKLKKSECA